MKTETMVSTPKGARTKVDYTAMTDRQLFEAANKKTGSLKFTNPYGIKVEMTCGADDNYGAYLEIDLLLNKGKGKEFIVTFGPTDCDCNYDPINNAKQVYEYYRWRMTELLGNKEGKEFSLNKVDEGKFFQLKVYIDEFGWDY